MTFATDILAAVAGEPIEAIRVGPARGASYWNYEEVDHDLGEKVVSWDQAKPVLDYDYDASYGSQDCHDVWVWTPTRVIFVWEYDGSTRLESVSRNPS